MDESKAPVPMTPASLPARAAALLPKPWSAQELAVDDRGPHRGAQWLLLGIAGFFVVALAWAALARIDEVTRGDGRIITASQTQYVQHLEGGIVTQILIREGQVVEKDQVLFRIDPTRQVSEFQGTQQEALALKARVARLTAEAQGTPLQMGEDVRKVAPALAQNEIALYEARRADLSNKVGILREQVAQRSQELVELRGRAERLNEGLGFLSKEISMTRPLLKDGVVPCGAARPGIHRRGAAQDAGDGPRVPQPGGGRARRSQGQAGEDRGVRAGPAGSRGAG
jgi:membrane fusion protein, adhesin transport system